MVKFTFIAGVIQFRLRRIKSEQVKYLHYCPSGSVVERVLGKY